MFEKLDTDKSGYLEKHEVKKLLRHMRGNKLKAKTKEEEEPEVKYLLDKIFRLADLNRDGKISYDEFFVLFYMIPAEKIRQNFNF